MSNNILEEALKEARLVKNAKMKQAEMEVMSQIKPIITEETENILNEGLDKLGVGVEDEVDKSEEDRKGNSGANVETIANSKGKKVNKKTVKKIEKQIEPAYNVDNTKDKGENRVDLKVLKDTTSEDEMKIAKESVNKIFRGMVFNGKELGSLLFEGKEKSMKNGKLILEHYKVEKRESKYCVMKKKDGGTSYEQMKCYNNKKDADDYCTALRINASGDIKKEGINKSKKFYLSLGELQKFTEVLLEKIIFNYEFVPTGHAGRATELEKEEFEKISNVLKDLENNYKKVSKKNERLKEKYERLVKERKEIKKRASKTTDSLNKEINKLSKDKILLENKIRAMDKVLANKKLANDEKDQIIEIIKESKDISEIKNIIKLSGSLIKTLRENQQKRVLSSRKSIPNSRLGKYKSLLMKRNEKQDESIVGGENDEMLKEEVSDHVKRMQVLAGIIK